MSRVERLRGAARRAAARHERRQRPLPDRALELERRAARRAGRRRDALHGLPLRAKAQRARGRPVRADGARRDRRPRRRASPGRTIGFEARRRSRTRSYERCARAASRLVADAGLVERLRAVKEPAEIERDPRGGGDLRPRRSTRSQSEQFTGRTERELAWRVRELFHEHGADGARVRHDRRRRPRTAPVRTPTPRDVAIPARHARHVDAGCRVDGYCSDCTRTFATGELPDELARAYEVCLEAQLAGARRVRAGRERARRGRRARAT